MLQRWILITWLALCTDATQDPDPLASFAAAGHSWPALPCRTFAGTSPAKSDGKLIYTTTDTDVVVWNDVSCSSSRAAADLQVTRAFREEMDAMAFLPPKTIVVASKSIWRGFHGIYYSRLRFYNVGNIGASAEPMFARRFDGQISSVLVLGDDLLISTIWNFKEEHYLHGLVNILSEPTVASVQVQTSEPVQKLLAFQDRVVGYSPRFVTIWRRQDLFAATGGTPVNWRVPFSNISAYSVIIQDICLVHPQYVAVAANPGGGFSGLAKLYVLDLQKAMTDGSFDAAELTTKRSQTYFKCLATISDLGFAAGTANRTVDLYMASSLRTTALQPYKQLRVVKSWPTKLGFLHGAYLAVGTADNEVQTFGFKRLMNGKSRGQPTMILPIESRVVDFLELPGAGLAVAGIQQVHFFSSSATQLNANSGRSTSFSSLRDCLDEKGLTSHITNVQPLSGKQVAVAVSDRSLIICKLHVPNIYKPRGFTNLTPSFASAILEMPQANLLAVGMTNGFIVIYNMSSYSLSASGDLKAISFLGANLMITSLASQDMTLMAGTQNRIYGWRSRDFRKWRKVYSVKHEGIVWDLAFLGNGFLAAAGDFEAVTLYTYGKQLTMVKSLAVKGPAFSMTNLNGSLLVATEFYVHLFQDALDPKNEANTSVAELLVNGVNSPPPANSISIVGDAMLVGLELYRGGNVDGQCAQGTFSAPGDFECHECPAGWTSYGVAGSCDYPAAETLWLMLQIVSIAILVCVWVTPKVLQMVLKLSKVCVSGPSAQKSMQEKIIVAALPYALLMICPVYALLFWGHAVVALAPLLVTLWSIWPGVPWGLGRVTLGSLAASSLISAVFVICSSVLSSSWGVFANLVLFSCNAYYTLHLRRWLNHSFVNTQDGIKANTAGVRVVTLVAASFYAAASAFSILTIAQNRGHAVWTPLGTADASRGILPVYLMAISSFFAMVSVGFAAKACLEAEDLHQTSPILWARDEKVPSARLPRFLRFPLLLRWSVWCKSWRSRHLLFMASALYDSYIFFRGLQHSKEALSSQFYDFAVILTFGIGTASTNAMALVLDHFHVKFPELGDRNFRLSSLFKCILLFLKLRVLKVPLVVIAHMDTSWLKDHFLLGEGERIPIWMCSDQQTCPSQCRNELNGNCTYTSQPAYIGCYCQYLTAGIPVTSDRLVVFGNCLISACVIALLTNSRMRTRGLFRYPELSLFALGCVTFLPTAFITVNTVYLSVPQLAKLHVDSWEDFLVLTIPALVFVLMANEMARRVETAWKLRNLAEKDKVKIQCSEGVWQVIGTEEGVEHLLGCRVEAVDAEGRSLLLAKECRHVTVQGPAVLLFKDPPRFGSLWVSSGFRALTPVAHLTTLMAIIKVWERLFQGVIFFDVLMLLILSFASGILNFTLLDEETRIMTRSASKSLTTQNLMDEGGDDSFSQTLSDLSVPAWESHRAYSEPPLLDGFRTRAFGSDANHRTRSRDRTSDPSSSVELQPKRKDLEVLESSPVLKHSNTS